LLFGKKELEDSPVIFLNILYLECLKFKICYLVGSFDVLLNGLIGDIVNVENPRALAILLEVLGQLIQMPPF
jgi:hypothetical protein